mmetsp:Transcript_5901/g.9841  ORF Transcript_5901/g.9841 Transcript_5901/m.9841 type:complete len:271 (-) Transcript_5901:238-1050(-)
MYQLQRLGTLVQVQFTLIDVDHISNALHYVIDNGRMFALNPHRRRRSIFCLQCLLTHRRSQQSQRLSHSLDMLTFLRRQEIIKVSHLWSGAQHVDSESEVGLAFVATEIRAIMVQHIECIGLCGIELGHCFVSSWFGAFVRVRLLLDIVSNLLNHLGTAIRVLCVTAFGVDLLSDIGKVVHKMGEWLAWIVVLPSHSGSVQVGLHEFILLFFKLFTAFLHGALIVQGNNASVSLHCDFVQSTRFVTSRASRRKIKSMPDVCVNCDLAGMA